MKYRKYILLILIISLFLNISLCLKVNAKPIYVNARSAIAIDSKSKYVLFEQNAEMLIPIASTTKIMTTLVALKYGNLDQKIEISKKSANIRGSKVGYKAGEVITLRELLYGLMLRSGNDAAIAIAEGISGGIEKFCELMNQYAIQIGALNSHFESPHGLDSNYHYSTAYDLALITAKAKENELFNKIVGTKDITSDENGFTRSYHNINKILYQIPKANGVKTGYTGGAGKCLVSSIKGDNDDDIIIVVLNCTPRWKETKKIHDYVRKNYDFKKIICNGKILDNIKYNKDCNLKVVCNKDVVVPIKKDSNYEMKIIKTKNFRNMAGKGKSVGRVNIYENGKLITSEIVYNKDSLKIEKKNNIIEYIKNKLKKEAN